MKTAGIVLLALGILALVYQGLTYTTREKVFEVGPITATKETKKTIPLPPIAGAVAVVAGIVLILRGKKA
ncbi:MAG TPA: DUF3185 domain-containing protein [Thermoanaerobaculia bacterium]|jgi:hypothetical protein|nr:DUF3185 domain-containing protein [Thermoanaerobaculia bacterium]